MLREAAQGCRSALEKALGLGREVHPLPACTYAHAAGVWLAFAKHFLSRHPDQRIEIIARRPLCRYAYHEAVEGGVSMTAHARMAYQAEIRARLDAPSSFLLRERWVHQSIFGEPPIEALFGPHIHTVHGTFRVQKGRPLVHLMSVLQGQGVSAFRDRVFEDWGEVALVLGALCESTAKDDVHHRALMWLFFGGPDPNVAVGMWERRRFLADAMAGMAPSSPFQLEYISLIQPPLVPFERERKAIGAWMRGASKKVLEEAQRGFDDTDAALRS